MTINSTEPDAWAEFKREFGLTDWPTPERFDPQGATLAPLRATAARGRPRKVPPVDVPHDCRYCFGCRAVLPTENFDAHTARHDGLRLECRACGRTARAARAKQRRRQLKLQQAGLLFTPQGSS